MRAHVPEAQGRVVLFGSWARDEIRQASDIDIALEPTGGFVESTLIHLREALEESTVPYAVEVVDLRLVDKGFKDRVATEGVRWTG